VFTRPEVTFHCDGQTVHMAPGEAWIFDNWRRHHVDNAGDADRIHLVADTTGTAAFWQFACAPPLPRESWPTARWDPSADPALLTERGWRAAIMPAAEVQLLIEDLCAELTGSGEVPDLRARIARFARLLESFVLDWRQLCVLHGTGGDAKPEFKRLAERLHQTAKPLAEGLVMRTNQASALLVLEKRVLLQLVPD